MPLHEAVSGSEWWRSGVIYQVYPRSFADSNADGMGDLVGITSKLEHLDDLGVDAIWLSPFYPSPQKDAGYDVSNYMDVDPVFGSLADFDRMLEKAHELGLRVMIDLVPNHTSDQHPWFQEALSSEPESAERSFYHFRDGRGETGEIPPNNWLSLFGGPAWTRAEDGQWFLHLFDSSQPDLNWENRLVREAFEDILRFWLDRGVDGFRVDQPHAMGKQAGLPDHPYVETAGAGFIEGEPDPPMWFQDSVHEIFRSWRKILESYAGECAMCGEAYVLPLTKMAKWVRPDEFHQTFNFRFLDSPWEKDSLVDAINESFRAFDEVRAPSTWVLNNHDTIRHVSRFGGNYGRATASDGIGPNNPQPDNKLGLAKAKAATLFMLGLPGAAYLYQGEELGLPEHTTIEPKHRQDPTFFRTNGVRVGRDGARVPLPWVKGGSTNGFTEAQDAWLPQPNSYAGLSRDQQQHDLSTLAMYTQALKIRSELRLGEGSFDWISNTDLLTYQNGSTLVIHNFGTSSVELPAGEVLLSSAPLKGAKLPANASCWISI
ncbi:MAG: glycoside hydrolase family 13 protein [Aquiluna sp.]|nr:glycoside hydrolase family 13 protein [Aquiluna sp.]